MTVTKEECDAVRDLALKVNEAWYSIKIGLRFGGSDYQSKLPAIRVRLSELSLQWDAAWSSETRDHFLRASTATRAGCASACEFAVMRGLGALDSTPGSRAEIELSEADVWSEWRAAVNAIK
jgi:hypothetical protein